MAVGDKSHLYAAAGLPVNTYVPSGQVNPHGSALNFSNAAGTNIFTGPHVGELGSAMNLSGINNNVPIANPHMGEEKIGNYSTGTYTPTAAQIRNQDNTDKYPLNDYSADDRFRTDGGMQPNRGLTPTTTSPNAGGGGGGRGGGVSQASAPKVVLNQMDLSQRTPSGSMYAPDLSAYNDSSLFNYTGPGGLNEYTYGQNLPYQGAGYDIWGSPTDVPNPYFWGQFGEEPVAAEAQGPAAEAQGPADGAIGLPPIDLPAGVAATNNNPNVGTNTTNINTGGGTGAGEKDLNYFETLAAMGIDPADAPSTTFPGPNDKLIEEQILNENAVKETLPWAWNSGANEAGNVGLIDYNNDGTISAADQAIFDRARSIRFPGDEDADFDAAGYDNFDMGDDYFEDTLARRIAAGMADNQGGLMAWGQGLQDKWDAQEAIQKKDNLFNQHFDRNQAEYKAPLFDGDPIQAAIDLEYPGATQITDFVDAIDGDTNAYKKILAQDGQISSGRGGIPVEMPIISDGDSENIFQNQDVDADAYQRALDKERYQTQINNPTADFSGYMKNYGSGFKEPQAKLSDVSSATPMQLHKGEPLRVIKDGPKDGPSGLTANDLGLFDYSADDRFRQTPQSIADVDYDARPMNRAHNASQMEVANTNIFDAKREDSPFAKGPSDSLFQGHMDEQQNYEVPAEEMSPGKVGLFNGIIEGLQNFGPNSERTTGEQKAWDKYYEYKNPAIEALNKGEIDEQAFNEIKGKVGSETIVNHFIDRGDHPYINSLASNIANTFYQGVDVIAGGDSIAEGLIDLHQQGAGSNDQSKLGSVGEVIAKAKEATQQRKEVQENIFTSGPMKFAAVASKPKVVVAEPKPVVKSKPVRTPVKKAAAKAKVTKPVRTPVKKAAVKKSSGPTKRKARGSYKKPAAKAVSTTFKRYGKRGGW